MKLDNTFLTQLAWLSWLIKRRFFKFGLVGASGILISLSALYLAQEYFFVSIQSPTSRLNAALAFAMVCATFNNFCWNRLWTWADYAPRRHRYLIIQFCQYALGCWLGVLLQFILTQCLSTVLHYLIANLLAILIASVFNFLVHHFWTFNNATPVELPRLEDKG